MDSNQEEEEMIWGEEKANNRESNVEGSTVTSGQTITISICTSIMYSRTSVIAPPVTPPPPPQKTRIISTKRWLRLAYINY